MKKRFNLYYIFEEEMAQTRMSNEKSAEIWRIIEALFHTLKHARPALTTQSQEEEKEGNE